MICIWRSHVTRLRPINFHKSTFGASQWNLNKHHSLAQEIHGPVLSVHSNRRAFRQIPNRDSVVTFLAHCLLISLRDITLMWLILASDSKKLNRKKWSYAHPLLILTMIILRRCNLWWWWVLIQNNGIAIILHRWFDATWIVSSIVYVNISTLFRLSNMYSIVFYCILTWVCQVAFPIQIE